jgi:hypothetical protein
LQAFSLLCAAALAAAGCRASPDLETIAKFQAAQEAFDAASSAEEFLRAAALYQEILDSGLISGAILYNQGNAFMRAGQRGRAIACYRQATRYLPRHPYLEANLRYALGSNAPVDSSSRSLLDYLFFWRDWISYGGKFRLAAAAAAAAFASGLLALFLPGRRALNWLALAALGLAVVLALSAAYDWRRYEWVEHGVVIRDEVTVRKGNAASYKPAFDQPLGEGAEFEVLERRGQWLLIRLPGGEEGWVEERAAVVF